MTTKPILNQPWEDVADDVTSAIVTAGEQLRAASESDWIDFMSEPSPFDQDDYDYADGFYARRALARHPATKPSPSVAKESGGAA